MGRRGPKAVVELDGYVVIDKPAGMTSHDVVDRSRGRLAQPKAGHAGTLDPDATGVLVVGLGRATRLMRFATGLAKSYVGEIVLGTATSTLDAAGEVTAAFDMSGVGLADVRAAAAGLTGRILQVPPMVSAVKVGGRRLHEIAREGGEVEREARPVEVTRFAVEPTGEAGIYRIEVDCSSGTYVRSLAADVGTALGGGAHLRRLRRVAIGPFVAAEAVALDELARADVRPPSGLVGHLVQVVVGEDLRAPVGHGKVLDRRSLSVAGEGPWAVVDADGVLLAVYEPWGNDRAKPMVVLGEAGTAPDRGSVGTAPDRGSAVAIGNFDGVHLGHRQLVARAIEVAASDHLRSVVLTFDRHPATVVRPESAPRLLTSVQHKLELLRATGVDEIVVLRFDAARAAETAEDFVRTVLVDELAARVVVVGASFRFGHGQGGDVALLESMGRDLGFEVVRLDLVADDVGDGQAIVSSSRIRALVAAGRLGEAAKLLGRAHELSATVCAGPPLQADRLVLEVRPELLVPPPGAYSGDVAEIAAGVLVRRGARITVLEAPAVDAGGGSRAALEVALDGAGPGGELSEVGVGRPGPGSAGGERPAPGAEVAVRLFGPVVGADQ